MDRKEKTRDNIQVIPLGGLGEIGKNITAFAYNNEIVVVDCGMGFPDERMYGIDLVIPDITYLLENKDKVKGFFITHGHEDHIGALPYILRQLNVPVYGSRLTIGLVENKLKEHKMQDEVILKSVEMGEWVELEHFKVEFIRSTHSIAGACCLALHTPLGIVLHTGDFKVDYTPIDRQQLDLRRIAALGEQGILLLLADSTNVERKGHSPSEETIGHTLVRLFDDVKGRIIVATFASNIHRIQQIANAAKYYGRKLTFSGRSMESNVAVARALGYLDIADEDLVTLDKMDQYPDHQLTIVTTGSQGEPMAALARIAYGTHRLIKIKQDDLFILSASPIPGNDKLVSRVINELYKKGAKVVYKDLEHVHVSGHAFEEELKLIHQLANPKYFVPAHGEYRHLVHHKNLAIKLGMPKENIWLLQDGDVLEIDAKCAQLIGKVRAGNVLVDGIGVGDVGSIVLRDRKYLAEDGMLIIVVVIDKDTFAIVAGPDVVTRGFVYAKNAEELLDQVKEVAIKELEQCLDQQILEWYILKLSMKKAVEILLFEKTKRRPSVFPIIMEV